MRIGGASEYMVEFISFIVIFDSKCAFQARAKAITGTLGLFRGQWPLDTN